MQVPTETQPEVQLKPTPIDPKTAATFGGEIIDLGEGVSSLGERIQKVQNIAQKNNALVSLSDSFNKIHNQYQTDPDLTNAYDRASVDLDKSVEATASTITDPEARNEFLVTATRARDSKATAINTMLQSRILQSGRSSLKKLSGAMQQEYNYANTPAQEEDIRKRWNDSVDELIDNNGVNPEAAENLRSSQNQQFGIGKALNDIDISNSPVLTQSVLTKLERGDYGDMPEKDYRHIQNSAQSREKYLTSVYEQKKKLFQNRNYDDLASKWNNHALTAQDLEEAKWTKKINETQYNKLSKAADLKIGPSRGTNPKEYNDLIQKLCDPEVDTDEKREALIDARIANDKKNGDGLNERDFNNLWNLHIIPTSSGKVQSVGQQPGASKDIQDIQNAENQDKKVKDMQSGWLGWIKTFNKHYDTNTASKVMQDAHDRLAKQMEQKQDKSDTTASDVEQACTEANAAYVGTHFPDYRTYPKEGKLFQMGGTFFKIHPNGQCTLGRENNGN